MIVETVDWIFATSVINLVSDSVVQMQNAQFNKFRDAIFFHRVMGHMELQWSKRVNVRFR